LDHRLVLGVRAGSGDSPTRGGSRAEKTIQQVLADHTDSLMAVPGIVGVAHGECSGQPCIRVFVVNKTEELLKLVPPVIEGYQVAVDETGEIKALEEGD
jgi:hypothetical protein